MENNINLLYKTGVFTLACLGLLSISAIWFMWKGNLKSDTRTFSVQGTGEVMVVPNKGTINGNFVEEAKTQKEANDKLSAKLSQSFLEFKKLNIQEKDIKTENLQLTPKYEYCYNQPREYWSQECIKNPNQNKIVGYTASQNISFSLDNKETLEKLIGLLAGLETRDVSGPNWEIAKADEEKAKTEAREQAVKEAKIKAEQIAKSLGQTLGKVVTYNENFGGGQPLYYARAAKMEMQAADSVAGAPVPTSKGESKVSVSVDISYELR